VILSFSPSTIFSVLYSRHSWKKEDTFLLKQSQCNMSYAMAFCFAQVTIQVLTNWIFSFNTLLRYTFAILSNYNALLICFFQQDGKFIFVNISDDSDYRAYHSKAIALSLSNCFVPFPSAFLIHKCLARGADPLCATTIDSMSLFQWQDWIQANGFLDENE
jgi:hypothetical protein